MIECQQLTLELSSELGELLNELKPLRGKKLKLEKAECVFSFFQIVRVREPFLLLDDRSYLRLCTNI